MAMVISKHKIARFFKVTLLRWFVVTLRLLVVEKVTEEEPRCWLLNMEPYRFVNYPIQYTYIILVD